MREKKESLKAERTRSEKSWERTLCNLRNRRKGRETKWRDVFCPQACYNQRAKENKHTRRATVQVNNMTTACTPRGRGRQKKVTVEEKGEEERTEGGREGGRQREIQSSLLMIRGTNDTRGERERLGYKTQETVKRKRQERVNHKMTKHAERGVNKNKYILKSDFYNCFSCASDRSTTPSLSHTSLNKEMGDTTCS